MRDKILSKITLYSLLYLILGTVILTVLGCPENVINITSLIACIALYVSFFFQNGKWNALLAILGIGAITLNVYLSFCPNERLNILKLVCLYAYYIYGNKIKTGRINKNSVFLSALVLGSAILSIFFNNPLLTKFISILNLCIILRLFNPYFLSLANKRKKHLEDRGFTKEDEKKIPLIKRLLFGRTGKIDWEIVEMFTGWNPTKNKPKES